MRILHLFNWHLNDIEKELAYIKEQGFDAVQINPLQPLKQDGLDIPWWMSYQPCAFKIGNQYGSKDDLIRLCETATYFDLKIFADVICSHVASRDNGELYPHERVDPNLTSNPYFWKNRENIANNEWEDRDKVINKCMGLPGLKIDNYDLQDIVIYFLNELIGCGVSGFRFDSAKSMALPKERCDFWERVLNQLYEKEKLFLYGEVIFESKEIMDEYAKYVKVLSNIHAIAPDDMIAYIESHDSFLEFGYTKNMNEYAINDQYAQLAISYPHTEYYARPFSNAWKDERIKSANKVLTKRY